MKTEMPFIDEISGLAMIKLHDCKTSCPNMIKVKFIRNTDFLDLLTIHQSYLFLLKMRH